MSWKTLPFEECIEKVKIPFKLSKKNYKEKGNFPVISQESNLISGYHNNKEHIFSVDKPIIVFGDHTCVLKYIDFNFVCGADGVKIIKPISEIDTKFFYYVLKILAPNTKGYARHYKLLKDLEISFPALIEQQRIVAKLDAVFAEIEASIKRQTSKRDIIKLLVNQYLSKISAEKIKLDDLIEIRTGKLDANAMVEGGKYPFFTCSKQIFEINDYAFDCDAVLLAGNNASGDFNVKHYHGKFNAYQRTYVLTVKDENTLRSRYLYFQLIQALAELKKMSVGANTKFLKIGMIKEFQIPLPEIEKQDFVLNKLEHLKAQTKSLEENFDAQIDNLAALKSAILKQEVQSSEAA